MTWMKPPLKIKVKNPWDTKHIDGVFLGEDIRETPERSKELKDTLNIALLDKLHFDNFTYNEEATILSQMKKQSITDQG